MLAAIGTVEKSEMNWDVRSLGMDGQLAPFM
jgi:hypothetical protein